MVMLCIVFNQICEIDLLSLSLLITIQSPPSCHFRVAGVSSSAASEYCTQQILLSMSFIIKSVSNGMVLDIRNGEKRNGAEVILWPYNGGNNQQWEYKNNMIYSKLGNYVLDIAQSGHGAPLITYSPHGGSNQKWYFDDDFTIRSGTGLVMDIEGGRSHQGTRIIGFGKHGGHNQKFRIEPYNRKW
ncbi:endo-1,4-beta-xylanase A [Cryptotermes secundus]|uniref:endo-1,4-beta-xylanase A n=1 Tax=Cryptotermes secundus TaxID=105785 RepID=UPI000CD7B195|nr:endo-1,4-beta-xylanase A [Cryptotermes secundus]